jgi:Tol biopolymer transport system component
VKAQALAGTEGASYPFWSPDSRSLGFFAEGKLKRIDIGGSPQTLADAAQGRGGTWTPDAGIVFSPTGSGPLLRVPSSGGATTPVTKLLPGQTNHRFPSILPDGRRFIFYAGGTEGVNGIYLGSLDSPDTKRLMPSDTAAGYLPGWLLSVRKGTLVAWPFDPSRGETVGEPRTVADPVGFDSISVACAFSASLSGAVAYRSDIATRRQLTWFDRSGKPMGTVGTSDENGLADPELSPDGTRIAIDRNVQNNTDVWIFNGSRSIRFTFDPSQDALPIWSPDGARIVFRSSRKGSLDLFEKPSSNAGNEQLQF